MKKYEKIECLRAYVFLCNYYLILIRIKIKINEIFRIIFDLVE